MFKASDIVQGVTLNDQDTHDNCNTHNSHSAHVHWASGASQSGAYLSTYIYIELSLWCTIECTAERKGLQLSDEEIEQLFKKKGRSFVPTTVLLPVLIQCHQCSPSWPPCRLGSAFCNSRSIFQGHYTCPPCTQCWLRVNACT